MLDTPDIPGGAGARARLDAMTAPSKKSVLDRWAKCVGASCIAAAVLIVVTAAVSAPSPEQLAAAPLHAAPVQTSKSLEQPVVQSTLRFATPGAIDAE